MITEIKKRHVFQLLTYKLRQKGKSNLSPTLYNFKLLLNLAS